MRSEPSRLGGISRDFPGIPPRRDENFPYEYAQMGQLSLIIEFSLISFFFAFQMLIKL